MTKTQALNLVNALAQRTIPCDCLLRYDQAGAEVWSVQLDTGHTYTGQELTALTNYCAQNNLQLTVQFQTIGVV